MSKLETFPESPNSTRYPVEGRADPNEFVLDPNESLVFQLKEEAENRGLVDKDGHIDLTGLAWQQDGQTHVVSSFDLLLHTNQVAKKATRLPRKHTVPGGYGARPVTQRSRIGQTLPYFERRTEIVTEDESVPRYTVDTYNEDGELIKIEPYAGESLFEKVFGHDNSDDTTPEHIEKFIWVEAPEKPSMELPRADVEVIAQPDPVDDTSIFDSVMAFQTQMKDRGDGRFNDWTGLTWRRGDHQFQIVRDVVVHQGEHGGPRIERAWMVKEYIDRKPDHIETMRVFRDDKLKKHFDKAADDDSKPMTDLRWEIPKINKRAVRPDQLNWAGWMAVAGLKNTAPSVTKRDLKDSYSLLSFGDLNLSGASKAENTQRERLVGHMNTALPREISKKDADKKKPERRDESSVKPLDRKYHQLLAEKISGVGAYDIYNLAKDLQKSYLESIKLLGLKVTDPAKASLSGIIWALLRNERHKVNTIGINEDAKLMGEQVDPFGTTEEASRSRRELIDRSVATDFIDQAIDVYGKEVAVRTAKGIKKGTTPVYKIKPEALINVQEFVLEEIQELLKPVTEENVDPEKLDEKTLNKLGRLLRQQFSQ
jgi:hypothetical protein